MCCWTGLAVRAKGVAWAEVLQGTPPRGGGPVAGGAPVGGGGTAIKRLPLYDFLRFVLFVQTFLGGSLVVLSCSQCSASSASVLVLVY